MTTPRPALLLCALPLLAGPARAAESYDNCAGFIDAVPAVIGTQGVWCLRKDLATAIGTGNAITITTNNVTLDCNQFKLGGLAAGPGTLAIGILAENRSNVTVRGCSVRGFLQGIQLFGGLGHQIEDNRLEGNAYIGINVTGAGMRVQRNLVTDTGGAPSNPGIPAGIRVDGDAVVEDNVVYGVAPAPGSGIAAAGIVMWDGISSASRNRVSGVHAGGVASTYGLAVSSLQPVMMQHNHVMGTGDAFSVGIYCSNISSSSAGNLVGGMAIGVDTCVSSGDVVNPN